MKRVKTHERCAPAGSRVTTVLGAALLASLACGCGDTGSAEDDAVPALTRDFGASAYAFVTQQADGGLTRLVLHSDGSVARLLVLKDGAVARSQSARFDASVRDAATAEVGRGQVNVDGDGSFADNDVVPATGFLVVSERELATSGIEVGTVVALTYDFRAVLASVDDVAAYAPHLFDE